MLIINIAGVILIALIIWWFWLYKPKVELVGEGDNDLVVVVENGVYSPSHILMDSNSAHELTFLRKDPSPCAEMLIIPQLEINENLPLNEYKKVNLPKLNEGEYTFHCQMHMYVGEIKVNSTA